MKRMTTLLGALVVALVFGAGQAIASEGGGDAAQTAGQAAASGQTAGGESGAYQLGPSNHASSIRVLSPGDDGSVSQSNTTTAGALAANGNATSQDTTQSQLGGTGSDQTQVAGQAAKSEQDADADATAVQLAPSNQVGSIRVLSPGDNGNVMQSNEATAGAAALNGNETQQTTDQLQGGGGYGSDQTQIAGQAAGSDQTADADATAVQLKPSNSASSIRVLSPGDDGNVSQTNAATAIGIAGNGNSTDQSLGQSQTGGGYGSDQTQVAGQEASNHQDADADATAVQLAPSNTASSIRVLSPGDDGDVSQRNSATAVAAALNLNTTGQSLVQSQAGRGTGGTVLQVAGQGAWNRQSASAGAASLQLGASSETAPIRVGSPGGGGSVRQSNDVAALAVALNLNETCQALMQRQAGSGSDQLQVAGQGSWDDQRGGAWAHAIQGGMPKKKR
ncbi:MAG: hypothetical protein M5U27_01660 [Gaiella sp.]|nr:hypothetical protein [Gaiella sp.]